MKSRVLNSFTGKQKAAMLLIALGKRSSAPILKEMSKSEVEMISKEIVDIDNVPKDVLDAVQEEFREMVVAQESIAIGGIEYASELLEHAMGSNKALEIIKSVQRPREIRGFNQLRRLDTEQLVSFLQKEHPQTIALVLTQLESNQASDILTHFPNDLRNDVMFRFATMDKVSPDHIKEIEKVLESKVELDGGGHHIGGLKMAASLLNMTDQTVEKSIMGSISQRDPELASSIKNLMFVFEDIMHLDDKSVQRVLKDVDMKELSIALKAASERMKEKFLTNMSERAADLIREEMEYMGPMKLKDVEKAQQKIVEIARRLDEEGEIVIANPGSKEEIIV